jgi:hypothetical protein
MIDTPEFMTAERIMTGEEYVCYSDYLVLQRERNEARGLLKRVLLATEGMTDSKEYYAAMLAAHCAVMSWKEGQ